MIIESLLDTDLYKFTMQQCVLHQFPAAEVSYRFKCRTPNIDLSPFIDEINAAFTLKTTSSNIWAICAL